MAEQRNNAVAEQQKSSNKRLMHISSRSPYFRGLSPMRRTWILLRENWWLLFIVCLSILVFFCYRSYKQSFQQASVTLAFNYQESSNGQYPNKTRLSMSDFKSDEVLSSAISLAGLDGVISPAYLSQCIQIYPTQVKYVSSSSQSYYLATSYNIYLSLGSLLDGVKTSDLLSLICFSYSNYFFENYTDNAAILSVEMPDLNSVEYYVAADILEAHANQLLRYLNMRINSTSSFNGSDSIAQCKQLIQQLNNFISYDIVKYRSYIMQMGLARDLLNYKGIITYDNMQKRYDYDRQMDAYSAYRNGLSLYDITMTASVLIPTLRSDNNYYMGKTKSAMDFFTTYASDYLAAASAINKELALNDRLLESLNAAQFTEEDEKSAESMIATMRATLENLAVDIQKMDEAYQISSTHDYLKFTGHYTTLTSRLDIRKALLACAAFLALTALLLFNIESRAKWKAPLQFANAKEIGDEQA